ncbi:rho guanine nucleotide exchange factor 19 [Pagrus major]|uniref:rho guanine nucleotide exchange factor 19 n=1 Tax=Pagrus major TaxID=143350 RepID=UPI003CC88F03
MAQSDDRDENNHCLSGSIMSDLHSWLGNPVNRLISQIQTMWTREQLSSEFSLEDCLEESSDSLKQQEDCRSVAFIDMLDFKNVSKLFSVTMLEEENPTLSPLDDQVEGTEGHRAAEPAEEEVLSVSFQSKYIDFFPLYQDCYLQPVKEDLHRLNESVVSELITPQYVQGLQSRYSHGCHSQAMTPPSPSPRPVHRVTPCTLWQDLDEVKASGLLSSLTTREICLQERMFELIGSEASYLRSLGVAVKYFYLSKALKQTLSAMEHHILFSNIRRVMAASEKFLMDLEIRLGESVLICQVGDIVLQHCPDFHRLYVPYVTNMMYQEALVNQLLQQNRDFVYAIEKLESDPVCQRQSLKSFLVLPFQRITRIKLILEGILKLTKPGSDSVLNLETAIKAIHEVVTECDNGVRKMKQIEELVCLEMLMDFGKVKSVPLVVSGRFLVHQGPVRQLTVEADAYNSRVSFISVYLHLFSDLLIISLKKDQRFTVVDYAKFPTHVHLEHLKTEVLGLPPDSFLLHLSQCYTGQPTAMILVPQTRADKEKWMKVLSTTH